MPLRRPDPDLDLRTLVIAVAAAAAGFLLVTMAGQALHVAATGSVLSTASPASLLVLAAAQLAGVVLGVAAAWARRPEVPPLVVAGRPSAIGPRGLGVGLVGFLAGVALQPPLAEVAQQLRRRFPLDAAAEAQLADLAALTGPLDVAATILLLVVVAPFAEETMFRGLVLLGGRRRLGVGPALASSTLGFAAIHGHPSAIGAAAVAGGILGLVALRVGSTALPIAIHAGVNAAAVGWPLLAHRPEDHVPIVWLLPAAVAAPVLLGIATRLAGDGSDQGLPPEESTTTTTPSR